MKNYILTITAIFSLGLPSLAQTIQGKIISNELKPLIGVEIYSDTTLLTKSKIDGTFELTIHVPTVLGVGYIGMQWENFRVSSDCENLEIILIYQTIYHYKSHSKIDRLRKKEFNDRVQSHEQAYKNGIFISPTPCITYQFVPKKPKLDEIQKWINIKKKEIKNEFNQLNIGDTIQVPYSSPSTNSVHTSMSEHTDYDCLITGTVIKKDQKKRGFNISYVVADLDDCIYETFRHNDQVVARGDTLKHNMKYARLLMVFSKR